MTQQFHEGQEVEVRCFFKLHDPRLPLAQSQWRKATILACEVDYYRVQFRDGTRATFDEAQIRAVDDHAARMLIRDRQNNPYDDASFDSAEYDLQARR